jgi:hypothetical protein
MKKLPTYLTANEVARETGHPASRIHAALVSGVIEAAGRAGNHKAAPVIFHRDSLPQIADAIRSGMSAKASALRTAKTGGACQNVRDVMEKFEALQRARTEVA